MSQLRSINSPQPDGAPRFSTRRLGGAVDAFRLTETEIWPGCLEIKVEGELDLAVSGELQQAIQRAASNGMHVLVDFVGCDFIDASGIAVLLRGDEMLAERGCQLLIYGIRDQVRRVLSATGVAGAKCVTERPPQPRMRVEGPRRRLRRRAAADPGPVAG